ncbi:PASTA domain-containing protein, partial [Gemmiger formicilis]
ARRMQTVPELMSALTDPNVANAMFERGDNQISTRKIMGVSLIVIVVLAILLIWSLLSTGDGQSTQTSHTAQSAVSETTSEGSSTASSEDLAETIPDLVGKRYASEIKDNELYTGYRIVMTEENSSEIPAGIVISQDPIAGTPKTEDNEIIQIVVSKGPNLVEMPDIIGFTQSNASKQLDERGIQYKMQIIENDGTMAEGCVAKTDVLAGTKFDAGKTIVSVFIAGERDDTLVATTGSSESESEAASDSTASSDSQ